ncbi:MAG: anti-sigma factor family protein [Armatimonadota bacterium]
MKMRLHCEEIQEELSSLIDGELGEERRQVVSAHLLGCGACSEMAGRLVAAKGLLQRENPQVEAPAGFMNRLHDHLDAVEQVRERVRQPGRPRRLTAMVAAGAIAMSLAIIFSTIFFISNDQSLELAQMHQQVTDMPGPVIGVSGFSAVSCDPGRDVWRRDHQTLVNLDGTLVTYTLYQVGTCPVSVYSGPADWEPYRTGWSVTESINGVDVRVVADYSMTSWVRDGHRHVLVAAVPPEIAAGLARTQMSSLRRSPGL